jgi:hypothetical protein
MIPPSQQCPSGIFPKAFVFPNLPHIPATPAMKSNLIHGTVAAACALLASCYPYPEVPPHTQAGPPNGPTTSSSQEQQKIQEERDRMKAADEKKQKEAEENNRLIKPNNPEKPTTGGGSGDNKTTKPPVEKPRTDWPFANPVPGKDGFVFSPYNQKVVDVRDIPSGTLVQDPTYPAAEKKYFRVP